LTIPPLNNGLGTNAGYFSRINPADLEAPTALIHKGFSTGQLDPKNFYVVTDDAYWEGIRSLGFTYSFMGDIDGFHVVVP
jgi:hypothetical protein